MFTHFELSLNLGKYQKFNFKLILKITGCANHDETWKIGTAKCDKSFGKSNF